MGMRCVLPPLHVGQLNTACSAFVVGVGTMSLNAGTSRSCGMTSVRSLGWMQLSNSGGRRSSSHPCHTAMMKNDHYL
jgi:hypothetical protein